MSIGLFFLLDVLETILHTLLLREPLPSYLVYPKIRTIIDTTKFISYLELLQIVKIICKYKNYSYICINKQKQNIKNYHYDKARNHSIKV